MKVLSMVALLGVAFSAAPVLLPAGAAAEPEKQTTQNAADGRRELQERLNALGYATGKPGNSADQQTIDAVRAFQRDLGHPATGRLTDQQKSELVRTSTPFIDLSEGGDTVHDNLLCPGDEGWCPPFDVPVDVPRHASATATDVPGLLAYMKQTSGTALGPQDVIVTMSDLNETRDGVNEVILRLNMSCDNRGCLHMVLSRDPDGVFFPLLGPGFSRGIYFADGYANGLRGFILGELILVADGDTKMRWSEYAFDGAKYAPVAARNDG